jgi:hypothetical protein
MQTPFVHIYTGTKSAIAVLRPVYRSVKFEELKDFVRDEHGNHYRLEPLVSPHAKGRPDKQFEYRGYRPSNAGWKVSREKLEELDNPTTALTSQMTGAMYLQRSFQGLKSQSIFKHSVLWSCCSASSRPAQMPMI